MTKASRLKRLDYLKDQLRKRIVILDGAMGTNIQKFKLKEEDYRGERFSDTELYPNDLKNNNDLLVLTRPEVAQPASGNTTISGIIRKRGSARTSPTSSKWWIPPF